MLLKVSLHRLNEHINVLFKNREVKDLGREVIDEAVDHNNLANALALQTSHKPRLEARWINENGRLVCKWLICED
ncbi:hypothetical protein [Nodosilinea nodulosa]|uniref:hypothetical protein n=1 Tax=Nodosilinea nodulosa TaxID=416001 RepID=UPI0012D728C1|nr:hypothetical protein [Nodosilinea nodulosa]